MKQVYERQCSDYLATHPDATAGEAWKAGYFTCLDNVTTGRRSYEKDMDKALHPDA